MMLVKNDCSGNNNGGFPRNGPNGNLKVFLNKRLFQEMATAVSPVPVQMVFFADHQFHLGINNGVFPGSGVFPSGSGGQGIVGSGQVFYTKITEISRVQGNSRPGILNSGPVSKRTLNSKIFSFFKMDLHVSRWNST